MEDKNSSAESPKYKNLVERLNSEFWLTTSKENFIKGNFKYDARITIPQHEQFPFEGTFTKKLEISLIFTPENEKDIVLQTYSHAYFSNMVEDKLMEDIKNHLDDTIEYGIFRNAILDKIGNK